MIMNDVKNYKHVLDIGSNVGDITRKLLEDKDNFVYSIEPIKNLYDNLKNLESNYSNLKVLNCAVSKEEGTQTFYINEPHYTSSLKKFNDPVKNGWPSSLSYNQEVIVETYKLSTIIKFLGLEGKIIEYIKIDTQGSDLDVIDSAENFLENIKEIKCEAFYSNENTELYENEGKVEDIIKFMENNNYMMVENEVNETRLWSDLTFKNKKFIY
jgi:FkbM family methyltransferase